MLRGFYTAASGMIAQQRQQEALSNNISNVNTPGYKADQTTLRAFPELLMQKMGTKELPVKYGMNISTQQPLGPLNTGVYLQEMVPNHGQGDIRDTGVTTDLAIMNGQLPDETGSVFFTVQNEAGDTRLTRNGNFTVDGQGYLVTNHGYYVLDQNGNPIQTDGMEITVLPDGVIDVNGQNIPLGLNYVADTNELVKEGNDLFQGEAVPIPANVTYQIRQGALERSNVDSLQMMTQMMESYRLFETNQRVLKAYDESMGKAVNEIGRIG
ncbi:MULTISPECIES: flagellar hook-basal body protein [unclassified Virgibacillus]|uniref:flagellar hook-basal body protein n=1 Tax=unclassified Virgibacillus TaxID=2620237 RepID=UPI0024DE6689|nr:flagellar hook-basal body protein [Virgibacillus sp. LDC-1]